MVKALHAKPASKSRTPTAHSGWKAAGWFGLLLAVIGLTDVSLHWFPSAFGTPEWEFGTVAAAFNALPLPTIGLAAVVGALLVNRARTAMMVTAGVLLALALLTAAAFAMFWMNVPMALEAADGPQGAAIYKGIVRTTMKGLGFGSAYLVAGIVLLRKLPPRT